MIRKAGVFFIFIALFFPFVGNAQTVTEELTIITYYPSPRGSYNELTTYSNTYLAVNNGSVVVGATANPDPAYKMWVQGSFKASGTVCAASSRELKTGIFPFQAEDYSLMIDKLKGVEVVHFSYKDDILAEPHLGVIAEDAPAELTDGAHKSINIPDYLGFLLAVVKEQQQQIDELKAKISEVSK